MTDATSNDTTQHSAPSTQHSTLGVVGSGTMGIGIVQIAAQRGYSVLMYDISDEILARSVGRLQETLDKLAAKGKLSTEDVSDTMGRISTTATLEDLAAAD